MKKRMLTALLCLCVTAALFPVSAFASGGGYPRRREGNGRFGERRKHG